jgi:hypothetical protein
MRDTVVSYIEGLDLGVFALSTELPFDTSGTPLYLKNMKRVYVGLDQVETTPIYQRLDGNDILQETTSVFVYLASDAKNLPTGYSDVVSKLSNAKAIDGANLFFKRESVVTTEFEADAQTTSIELRFTRITNS